MSETWLAAGALAWLMVFAAAGAEELFDPMRPFAPPPPAVSEPRSSHSLQLSAILFSPQRRVAVVNGEALSEGDRVGGARIVHIGRDAVELAFADRRVVLRLGSPEQSK